MQHVYAVQSFTATCTPRDVCKLTIPKLPWPMWQLGLVPTGFGYNASGSISEKFWAGTLACKALPTRVLLNIASFRFYTSHLQRSQNVLVIHFNLDSIFYSPFQLLHFIFSSFPDIYHSSVLISLAFCCISLVSFLSSCSSFPIFAVKSKRPVFCS